MRHIETEDYAGPDRRYRPNTIKGVLSEAYDVGALVRGVFQLLLIGSAIIVAWNRLENMASSNQDRIGTLEAIVRTQAEQLGKLPIVAMKTDNLETSIQQLSSQMRETALIRETLATLTERISNLNFQLERLERAFPAGSSATGR